MIIEQLASRVSELENRLMNLCRIGQVEAVDPMTAKVDVTFEEGLTVQGVPFLTMRAGEDQTYWLPSVGELGVLLAPSGDIANSLFLPAIFYTDFPASDAMSGTVAKRIFRGDDPHVEEEVDTDANSCKLSSGDSERFIDSGKIEDKVMMTRLVIEATGITLYVAGIGRIQVTAASVNVGGATFANGVTNMITPTGPVTYPPVPIT